METSEIMALPKYFSNSRLFRTLLASWAFVFKLKKIANKNIRQILAIRFSIIFFML